MVYVVESYSMKDENIIHCDFLASEKKKKEIENRHAVGIIYLFFDLLRASNNVKSLLNRD